MTTESNKRNKTTTTRTSKIVEKKNDNQYNLIGHFAFYSDVPVYKIDGVLLSSSPPLRFSFFHLVFFLFLVIIILFLFVIRC